MTHLMEPVSILPPISKDTHDEHCVFCKEAKVKGPESKIGQDNNSKKLAASLAANGVPRCTFTHPHHGTFSSEPHHLLPGNEALKAHPLEKWLSTKVPGSKIQADTGFDINLFPNGAWLPSVPETLVRVAGWNWRDRDYQTMAVDLMLQEQLQFHKGGHTNKGGGEESSEPSRCYTIEVESRLDDLLTYVNGWSSIYCPMVQRRSGSSPPPAYLNDLLYQYISACMMLELSGPPEAWRLFISRVAYVAHMEAKKRHVYTKTALSR